MNVLDLFSGIGGFSLGLERAGMRTRAFCESDEFCRRVLRKHWPDVPCYDDVRTVDAERFGADGIGPIDVICGGWPCTDLSVAGRGAGLDGPDSGLWTEFARIIGDVRPRFAIMENVAILAARGLDRVLGDLAALGYDAEWHCIPASAVGAPHRRDRIWIIAYPGGDVVRDQPGRRHGANGPDPAVVANHGARQPVADAQGVGFHAGSCEPGERSAPAQFERPGDVADPEGVAVRPRLCAGEPGTQRDRRSSDGGGALADARGAGLPVPECGPILNPRRWVEGRTATKCGWWSVEPDVGRVAHGVRNRVDRLRSLGNSLVPQIPEIIGRAIMDDARPYNVHDDINKSLAECYRAIKARQAAGGPGWPPNNARGGCPHWPDCGCGTQSGPHTCEWKSR
jgi:DNA (cytosine-5)-methyltransferase 1